MTEFETRRQAFADAIGDAVAVIPSAEPARRSGDGEYQYRQNSDFFYLCGCEEPESVLVIAPRHKDAKSVLFVRPRDREREVWEGKRVGPERAAAAYGVDAAYPIGELATRLPGLLDSAPVLYYALGENATIEQRILAELKRYRIARQRSDSGPLELRDPGSILHEMRLKKSPADVERAKRACAISREGHIAAMRAARPGMHEYEIEAVLEYVFTSRGAQSPAYPSIVAGGSNATVLHYISNRARVPDDALVLVDAGAEVDYFAGDITRTWPISGRFTAEQKAIYEIVLAAQRKAIESCRPGARFGSDVHDATVRVLVDGLIDIGVLAGTAEENIEKQTFREYYMHRTGHWLGMDVHDVGFYRIHGDWRPLEAGMIVTVEPGLYMREDSGCPPRFRGIGVRIEDDILITPTGNENLTAGTPKSIDEIERVMAEGRNSRTPLPA